MKNIKKNIQELFLYMVFIAILAIGTPKALSYFMDTKYPVASITSSSMWPTLKKDDIVFIKNIAKDELKVGDIVVYKNNNTVNSQTPVFTIHRIIKLNKTTIKTRGDANKIADPLVKYENVIGRTLNIGDKPFRIPYLGKITSLVSNLR